MADFIDLPFDDWDGYYGEEEPRIVQCRLCGSTNVYWQKNQQTGRWELRDYGRFAAGKLHVCKPTDRQHYIDDAFDDIS